MSKLYNPELVPKEEIKRTFVGRHKLVEEIVSIIESQPQGAGVQHLIIVAPRGMGKTTLLLMLRFAVEDGELSNDWQPIQFPEESYDVYELSDFWMKIAEYLAEDTGDENLRAKIAEIKSRFTKNEDLYEAAYALLKDWRRKNNKRILLLIDNFDMILEQINSEQDAARLRKVLMNDDTVMLIGSAVTFFQEVRGYEHPLYNFFKIYNLEGFKEELIEEFLRIRAEEAGIKDFEQIMRENRPRIRTLAYFTDGNPRLVLMLFDVITNSKITDVEKALEKLLDEITPYLKSKIELLAPQMRKILDYIAKMSFEKREGVTPTEIAAEVRLSPNQTSSQLKRLANDGYVRAANISGRSSFYVLSEPLIAIWYQMRFGRTAYQKRRWLIFVLKSLYELEEFRNEQKRLRRQYQKAFDAGENAKANDFLRHILYLAEAMPEFSGTKPHFQYFVSQSMALKSGFLKEELKNPDLLKRLSPEDLDKLQTEGYITENQCAKAKTDSAAYEVSKKEHDSFVELIAGQKVLSELKPESRAKQLQKILEHFNCAIELNNKNTSALYARSHFFYQLGKYREALVDIENQIKIFEESVIEDNYKERESNLAGAYGNKSKCLIELGRFDEAIQEIDKAYAIFEKLIEKESRKDLVYSLALAHMSKGNIFDGLNKFSEAINEYEKSIRIYEKLVKKENRIEFAGELAATYMNKGNALSHFGELEKAIREIDKTILIYEKLVNKQDPKKASDLALAYMNKGSVLGKLRKEQEAIIQLDKAIIIFEDLINNQNKKEITNLLALSHRNKGVAYDNLNKKIEAIEEYDKSIKLFDELVKDHQDWKLPADYLSTIFHKITALINLKDFFHASELLEESIKFFEDVNKESLNSIILKVIFSAAEGDDYSNIRKLLQGEELEERFFPILRAIDYLETGDEDLIEKLSPEVRGVVEEAVRVLRQTSDDDEISEPVKKTKKRKK